MKTKPLPIILGCLMLALPNSTQSIPQSIHYQGYLRDMEGRPVNGPVAMEVRVFVAETSGTPIYRESLGDIEVTAGHYQFTFGASGATQATIPQTVRIAVTDGMNKTFVARLDPELIASSLVIYDGSFTWNPTTGSSNPTAFAVAFNHSLKQATVSYQKGTPVAGREIHADYHTPALASISTVLATAGTGEAYLALVLDGVESSVRDRLQSVPYAMHAMTATTSHDAQDMLARVDQLEQDVQEMQNTTQDGLTHLGTKVEAVSGNLALLRSLIVTSGNYIPEGMIRVEGGKLPPTSVMGARNVSAFQIGLTEVTWGQWQTVRTWAAANGYDIGSVGEGCTDEHPVGSVTWYDVVKWCNAKSEMEGMTPFYLGNGEVFRSGELQPTRVVGANGYRLPTEAEWEFAARGGNQTNGFTYSGSNNLNTVGWYWANSGGAACDQSLGVGAWPVGLKAPNELGLYDMSGNVWEWCEDWRGSPVIRGCSWNEDPVKCPVAHRDYGGAHLRTPDHGFRLARSSGN